MRKTRNMKIKLTKMLLSKVELGSTAEATGKIKWPKDREYQWPISQEYRSPYPASKNYSQGRGHPMAGSPFFSPPEMKAISNTFVAGSNKSSNNTRMRTKFCFTPPTTRSPGDGEWGWELVGVHGPQGDKSVAPCGCTIIFPDYGSIRGWRRIVFGRRFCSRVGGICCPGCSVASWWCD